ncbi:MAG: hypothetical protein QOJ62_3155 [Actinomycetota bacterium]|nr:hypothetical protein [Actinomycetota bacterium]
MLRELRVFATLFDLPDLHTDDFDATSYSKLPAEHSTRPLHAEAASRTGQRDPRRAPRQRFRPARPPATRQSGAPVIDDSPNVSTLSICGRKPYAERNSSRLTG